MATTLRLADDDAAVADGDERVGGAEIDPDVVAEEAEQAVEESQGPSGIELRRPVAREGWREDGLRLRGTADAGETLAHGLGRGADQDRSVASVACVAFPPLCAAVSHAFSWRWTAGAPSSGSSGAGQSAG